MIVRGSYNFVAPSAGTFTISLAQDLAIRSGYVWEFNAGMAFAEITGAKDVIRSGAVSLRNKQPVAGKLDLTPMALSVTDPQSVCVAPFESNYGVIGSDHYAAMKSSAEFIPLYDRSVLVEDFNVVIALLTTGATAGRVAWMIDVSEVKRDVSRLDAIQRSLL